MEGGEAEPKSTHGDELWRGAVLVVRAMTRANDSRPAQEWLDRLAPRHRAKFEAAAEVLETSLVTGRPPAGRAVKVQVSTTNMWELRITKEGANPPHLRLFYVRRDWTLWAACGFTKTSNGLRNQDVAEGDRITNEWSRTLA